MKTKDSYLDLLFENRNKAYGAYELRINYEKRLMKSFGMALLIAGLFFLVPYLLTLFLTKAKPIVEDDPGIPYVLQPDIIIEPEHVKPVHTTRTLAEGFHVVKAIPPETRKPDPQPADNPNAATTTTPDNGANPDDNGGGGNPTGGHQEIIIPPVTMGASAVDVAPAFPGGDKELMKFLQKNLHYSAFARENGITGRVFVSFVVNEKGEITEIKLQNRLEQSLDAEVLRVVNIMPLWSPGIYKGQAVRTAFMLPVSFALK